MYFKWSIGKLRSSTSTLQAAEFYFYDSEQNKIAWVNASITTDKAGVSSGESIGKLIDGSKSTKYCTTQYSGGPCNIVITVDDSMKYPAYYSYVTANDSSERDPVSWTLYASKDGETWTQVDTQSNVTIPSSRYTETDKWSVLPLQEERYLLQNGDIYYTITKDKDYKPLALEVTELTSQVFLDSGFEDSTVITPSLVSTFADFKILKWTDGDKLSLSAALTAVPLPQTIISNAIDLTDETITGIEAVTAEYEGTPVVAISFDDKATWQMYDGTQWVSIDKETSGMQMETLMAITTEQWAAKISGLSAIYLRTTLSAAEDKITSVEFNFTN